MVCSLVVDGDATSKYGGQPWICWMNSHRQVTMGGPQWNVLDLEKFFWHEVSNEKGQHNDWKTCKMSIFINCTLHHILLGWSNQGWCRWNMYYGWGRWEYGSVVGINSNGSI
jgi:hypothetical protein